MSTSDLDCTHMAHALRLAACGEGHVEPNPMVGCVIAHSGERVGEGWHQEYGGPHAEARALAAAGDHARGATLYVTLEPCCHEGKTPPCTTVIIEAGVARVVVALGDPFPQVSGCGVAQLEAAGIAVDVGLLEAESRQLCAPYLKRVTTGRPWTIAKWAMSRDGKIATPAGASPWISCEASRAVAHELRGRMDAMVIGRGTAEADDPLLTARPPGPRVATRIIVDSFASLSPESQLVRTAGEAPVLVAASDTAPKEKCEKLANGGVEVLRLQGAAHAERLDALLAELGRRRMTNVLVEGGARLLTSLFDASLVDEVHVFLSPKIIGGAGALAPVTGEDIGEIAQALNLVDPIVTHTGNDEYLRGRIAK